MSTRHGKAISAAVIIILTAIQFNSYAQASPSPTARHTDPVDEFFASGTIPNIKIEIAQKQIEALRKSPREYVHATVRESAPSQPDKFYPNIAVHLKARWGSFRAIDDRPAFTLDFCRYDEGETFHGLRKLHLNNSVQDPTFLSENVGRTLFRAAGVPVARAGHARVWLNGKDMGFYVLLEGIDRPFLKRSFGDKDGLVFEGDLQEIDQPLSVAIAEKTPPATQPTTRPLDKDSAEAKALKGAARTHSLTHLLKLAVAIKEPNPATRRQKVAELVDVDQFFTFMAMELLTAHWDGYVANRNNYRVYANPATGQIRFFAHGMDQLFQRPDYPLIITNGAVARVLLESAEDKLRFIRRVAELRQTIFTPEAINKRIDEIAARTLPALAAINPDLARQHTQNIASLKQRVAERCKNVDRQLAAALYPPRFDSAGFARLDGWQFQQDSGSIALDFIQENGKTMARIRSTADNSVASLRTMVLLTKGKYTFEGNCRTVAITPAADASGVSLRISDRSRIARFAGTTAWNKRQFDFEVTEPAREIVFVCELRARAGEAWFDLASLRLQKH